VTAARVWSRLRALPLVARDALLAAAVAGVDLSLLWVRDPVPHGPEEGFAGPSALAVGLLLLLGVPLAWRRVAPHVVMATTLAATTAAVLATVPTQAFAPLVALYTVAGYRPRRESVPWLAAGSVLAGVLLAIAGELQFGGGQLVIIATAWLLGDRTRALRERDAVLRERAAWLERDRERAAELAASEERTRIARELHDVLAHSVSLMVVQAAAARRVLGREPDRARGAVAQVVATGEDSLGELRRMVGLLGNGEAERRPQPRLDELAALVDGFREAGVPVVLDTRGTPRALAPGLELSAYRIVQESLTNVLKHAGAGASVTVTVTYGDGTLVIDVTDDGVGNAAPPDARGHGIDGMRERALLLGGELEAGPHSGGGFRVRAALPTGEWA
jgi:signal transduction histidine kinase